MARIIGIKTAIINKISTISDFVEVLGYKKFEDIGFPTCFITYQGSESSQSDNIRNLEKHKFNIDIIYDFESESQSESILIDLVEKVIDKIDDDRTFGSLLQNTEIVNISRSLEDDAEKIKIITVELECSLFKNRG